MNAWIRLPLLVVCLVGSALITTGCEPPPVDTVQRGFRGTGMVQVYNPKVLEAQVALNHLPEAVPAAAPGGPAASTVFKNVQVLGDLSVNDFTRLMVAMTNWVAPKEGCAYCHDVADMAADKPYTKIVARRMIQMTRHINTDWKAHVADTGVTCYTCHRGQPVPANVWTNDPGPVTAKGPAGNRAGQNAPAKSVAMASLPFDPFTPMLVQPGEIRVVSSTALPGGNERNIKDTEWTYGLMMHMSQALGVNCTFCHNSRSFAGWSESTPQRSTAWHGIQLVRDLNVAYLDPLKASFPPERLGPLGDAPKANCATCHQGAFKPLLGASMLKDHPELAMAAKAAAPAPAAGAAPAATTAGLPGKVFFESGKADLGAEGKGVVEMAARLMQADAALKVDLSGFADKTGNPDANLELGKQRAMVVRDALKAAGIAEDRINLKKPEFVIGDAAADARRVEINAAK